MPVSTCPLLPHYHSQHRATKIKLTSQLYRPFTLLAIALSAFLTTICALLIDHAFYNPNTPLATIFTTAPPPLRSLLYNLSTTNLSTHGLHPRYTHILINLPLLLGPVIPLLLSPPYSPHLISPVIATAILSLIPHQEPRFLLPVIPLLLSCTKLPTSRRWTRVFVGTWVCFNLLLAILMGVYHQGGVVPMQIWLGEHFNNQVPDRHANTPIEALHIHQRHPTGIDVLWWRTYSPPIWLLDGKAETTSTGAGIRTIDLMGIPFAQFIAKMEERTGSCDGETRDIIVVAPRSSTELDGFRDGKPEEWRWEEVWTEWRQLNLDDMDWAEDGVLGTVGRVVGRRGLGAWKVERICP
ncbi:alpha 1,2 mannosyltransferase [Ptychographa xylographoides]|nr:alpha 1,2 mannosyltransferase [Ptychographa xylographoides]